MLVDTSNMAPDNKNNISASISVGESLRALAFSEDAVHTAVGTESGRILIYDWLQLYNRISLFPF